MTKLRAVLFDLDGTLRDSREVINPAIEHALNSHGVHAGPEAIAPYAHSLRAVHRALAPEDVPYTVLEEAYDQSVQERFHLVKLYEHVPETLEWLQGHGYLIGMVSSGRRARDYLKQESLIDYFDVVIGGNDVRELKPHPEAVLAALGALACLPEEAAMVGDLAADVIAGQSAGVATTIGLTHGFGSEQMLREAGADYIIASLDELPGTLAIVEHA